MSDFLIGGVAVVRTVDATAADDAMVRRQLGVSPSMASGEPDVVLRFVDDVPLPNEATYVGADAAVFRGALLLLRGPHKARVRTVVPLADIGAGVEFVCERGASAVPLLLQVLNVVMASRGVVALHASGFTHAGLGVLVTGWAKGGKTEALLGFAQAGARYVSDEWTYITPDGRMRGIPEPIRMWNWQLSQLPRVRQSLSRRVRAKLWAADAAASVLEHKKRDRRGTLRTRVAAVAANQANVRVPPSRLFAGAAVPESPVDRIVLVTGSAGSTSSVSPVDGADLVTRMVQSLQEEREPLLAAYRALLFASPRAANPLLDRIADTERELLTSALQGAPVLELRHPHPPQIADLVKVLEPALAGPPGAQAPHPAQAADQQPASVSNGVVAAQPRP